MNAPTNNTSHSTQTDAGVPPAPPEAHQQAGAAEVNEGQGDEDEDRTYSGMRATYSPDDNKLRLYSVSRLDAATFERVKAAGFKWAPKQGLFVAPMWTPGRADLLLELCGDIDDEDTSLVERAEERADRFEGYSDRRGSDADAARRSVRAIADHIPFGQPILVGHHSERRARRDAQRIQDGMRRAVKLWETSTYWQQRAKGAVRAAKYKERVDVRHRRIKTIEAERRKQQRIADAAEHFLKDWQVENLTHDQALVIAGSDHVSRCFPLAEFPRALPASQYEGSMDLWSALKGGVIDVDTARVIAIGHYTRAIARTRRWIEHYDFRLAYERAMLGEQGGLPAERFELEVGGQVLAGGEWCTVLRITRRAGRGGAPLGLPLSSGLAAPRPQGTDPAAGARPRCVQAVGRLLIGSPGLGRRASRCAWCHAARCHRCGRPGSCHGAGCFAHRLVVPGELSRPLQVLRAPLVEPWQRVRQAAHRDPPSFAPVSR